MTALRPAAASDAEAVAGLRFTVAPFQVFTREALRHGWASATEADRQLLLVAEEGGEIVGFAQALRDLSTTRPGAANAYVMVHPDFRKRGIGGQLYARAEAHLREAGATFIVGRGSGEFPIRHGFERRQELRYSHLDLTGPLPSLATAPGADAKSFREAGPQAVFPVMAATIVDEPGDVACDAITYTDWFQDTWSNPDHDHDSSVVVVCDGAPVSYTVVGADRATGRMWSDGTGTLRSHRGRGLAKYAKSVALRRAAAAGVRSAYAGNDETNRPMIAINEWLGYRPCATQWSYAKVLSS